MKKLQGLAIALVVTILFWLSFATSTVETGTVKIILKLFGIEFSAEVDKQRPVRQSLPQEKLNVIK